jgi:hypothetical protein
MGACNGTATSTLAVFVFALVSFQINSAAEMSSDNPTTKADRACNTEIDDVCAPDASLSAKGKGNGKAKGKGKGADGSQSPFQVLCVRMHVCAYVIVRACVCLPTFLSACLPANQLAWLSGCLSVCQDWDPLGWCSGDNGLLIKSVVGGDNKKSAVLGNFVYPDTWSQHGTNGQTSMVSCSWLCECL